MKNLQSVVWALLPYLALATADCQKPFLIAEGDDWVPWMDMKDIEPGSALDLSTQGFAEAPAGKYGWLRNVDGHFEFEGCPGVKVRFAGVNLCNTMCYPSHEEADRLIRRLRALGYNSIRLHHYDRELVAGSSDGLGFNPERLDRLDYLVAKAIENGLYVTTDLYVSRPVTWRQMGVDREGSPEDLPGGRWLYKVLIAFHEGAYQNWKAFATAFLTHVNPYTGRRYADEPGLPLLSMVNEANYRMAWKALVKEESFQTKWKEWAEKKRREDSGFAAGADLSAPERMRWNKRVRLCDTAPAAFLADNEDANFARQQADMRALGAKALFTSINHLPYYAPDLAVRRRRYDYFDDHLYIDHPGFPGKGWKLPYSYGNTNPLQDSSCRFDTHAFFNLEGIPFTLSEFNFCGPNAYRGMNGLLSGVFMAGQDVSGYWQFAYSHSLTNMYDGVGVLGHFDSTADPLNLASERMMHFLYLRGDFQPFSRRVVAVLPDAKAATRGVQMAQPYPEWRSDVVWKARISCAFPDDVPSDAQTYDMLTQSEGVSPVSLQEAEGFVADRTVGTVRLATARTCGVSVPCGRLSAGVLEVEVREGGEMTTVMVTSLDGQKISQSGRLLLTHLTDVQADGATYADKSRKLMLKSGTERKLVRMGVADVRLRVDDPGRYEVFGLDSAGCRTGRIDTSTEEGCLTFTVSVRSEAGARICYEIVKISK